jgi:hypothetical protein
MMFLGFTGFVACDKGELKEDSKPVNGTPTSTSANDAVDKGAEKSAEKSADKGAAVVLDHSKLDGLLKKFVNDKGRVNYNALKGDAAAMADLKAYTAWAGTADISKLGRDEKLAFYINAYNAHTMKAVIDRHPLKSVLDVKAPDFFKEIKHKVAGEEVTLDTLENGKIRGAEFSEARIHFVVNCASTSCPKLQRDAITAKNLESLLEAGAKEYVLQETKLDAEKKVLDTSNIFNWFADDFKKSDGTVQNFLAKYMDAAKADTVKASSLTFHEYDWTLNEQKN